MDRRLLFIEVLVVALLNSLVLFYLSLFATGGDGSADGVNTVRWVGGSAIALFTAWALLRWHRQKPAVGIAALALPSVFLAALAFILVGRLLGFNVG